jgi:hypothetical protein
VNAAAWMSTVGTIAAGNGTGEVALIGAVLIASMIGSTHCAGMCGGLMLFALEPGAPAAGAAARRFHARLQALYHGGRGVSYTLLGVAAGWVGAVVDLGGRMAGVQRSAAMLAGAAMGVFGVVILLHALGVRVARLPMVRGHHRLLERGHRAAMMLSAGKRAMTVGLLTPLLPCGWLYAFVVTSAGTGSAALGGAAMAVFWLGTLPVMAAMGAGLSLLTGPLRARLPVVTALIVVIVGVLTATGRMSLPSFASDAMVAVQPAGLDGVSAAARVRRLDPHAMACCNPEPVDGSDGGRGEAEGVVP